jgi:hypothetical protein
MDKGVLFLERGKRDVAPMFKKKDVKTTTTRRPQTGRPPVAGHQLRRQRGSARGRTRGEIG